MSSLKSTALLAAYVFANLSGIPSAIASDEVMKLTESGGVFTLPVRINDKVEIPFELDTGASEVVIPEDVFSTLQRTGTISSSDFIGNGTAVLADGSTTASRRYTIHKMSVGNHTVSDVVAGVAPIKAAPLLGQSFLSKLPAWAIDYVQSALVFNPQLADYESQLAIYKTRLAEYEKLGTATWVAAQLAQQKEQILLLGSKLNTALAEKSDLEATVRRRATLTLPPGPTTLPPPTPPSTDPTQAFNQGWTDRQAYEFWINSLPEDNYKQGALYWASVRSTNQAAVGCTGSGYTGTPEQADWARGCYAAKTRLDPTDYKRHQDPNYRAGWNSIP